MNEPCPRCGEPLAGTGGDWWRCSSDACPYELPEQAYRLYCELSAMIDHDPDTFFKVVSAYCAELRAREPAWTQ
ncbi:hypothetical protein [Streptomyces sp. NRRL F-4489]|uniref:hypothetical protein n=1 Tax=Streptomyces sp. NRRL F-4489 TaxID=1609095 RepID=UPI0008301368|nr:hypothetical protein [Streptomyces sp. NRRL F-4489]